MKKLVTIGLIFLLLVGAITAVTLTTNAATAPYSGTHGSLSWELDPETGALTITGETIVTIISCIVIMTVLTLFVNKTKATLHLVQKEKIILIIKEYQMHCVEEQDTKKTKNGKENGLDQNELLLFK